MKRDNISLSSRARAATCAEEARLGDRAAREGARKGASEAAEGDAVLLRVALIVIGVAEVPETKDEDENEE